MDALLGFVLKKSRNCKSFKQHTRKNTMARETVAQRNARFEVAIQEQLSRDVAEYPERLMAALTRASDAGFDLTVCSSKFQVDDRNNDRSWSLDYAQSPNSQRNLENLEYTLDHQVAEAAEANRRHELARNAFNRLSVVEQQALGLNSRFNW
jgi:hypothetical protein